MPRGNGSPRAAATTAATTTSPRVLAAIVTVPPHAPFVAQIAHHPLVAGLRLNTVMPVKGRLEDTLERLLAHGKPLWVDLKGRQLRIVGHATPPFTDVRLSHRIRVETPATAWFGGGRERATILEADGDRLILADGPRRVVGPGESVNIVDASLEVDGTLTDGDRAWVRAARAVGLHDYMLSFVEREEDAREVRALDPDARVVLKIESPRGVAFARERGARAGRLMAARGDLAVEVGRPARLLPALRAIVAADPDAIVASRLFPSLLHEAEPAAQDVTDVAYLLALGYRTFMLGDEICLSGDTAVLALNLLAAVAREEGVTA